MNRRPKTTLAPPQDDQSLREYLDQSDDFRVFLENKRLDAIRAAEDLANEITGLETQAQRIRDDAAAEIRRLDIDIDARALRRAEQVEIIARCDGALGVDLKAGRPAPTLTERSAS